VKVSATLRIALPFILIAGAIGALVGGPFDETAAGIRVGVIVGGVAAFVYLQRKKSRAG
jgi:hypothetical protein